MIEETPWLRQAENESQARKNVGILFDDNRLNYETEATLRKLTEMQLGDGSWPWFPGGRGNDYITLYITTGFGRLRHLGVDINVAPAIRSLQRLDAWMTEQYERIQKWPDPEKYVPSSTDALYLYGRSFFLKDMPIAPQHKTAVDFFLKQARKFWLKTDCRQTQGHLAIALHRFNAFSSFNDSTPSDIMKSIKERSVSNEEMGMFWRDTELSWWWYRAPDRDPGADDRGVRRSDGRPAGRRGLPRLAAQAEADPGLEDHQSHRRCRLCPAAARQGHPVQRRAGAGEAGRRGRDARSGGKPEIRRPKPARPSRNQSAGARHRLLRIPLRPGRHQAEAGRDHREEGGRKASPGAA